VRVTSATIAHTRSAGAAMSMLASAFGTAIVSMT
jgi:hypothetical protein